jgi:tRNA (Thr-GGU) A37 N-methylase
MDDEPRGVFATRAPSRPNPIGLSVVRLIKVEGNILHVENVDILDGTPLLDIKPYVPQFDHPKETVRIGWLEKTVHKVDELRANADLVKQVVGESGDPE